MFITRWDHYSVHERFNVNMNLSNFDLLSCGTHSIEHMQIHETSIIVEEVVETKLM